ncbi:MAG TPA: DoxX family protein [Beijerinckiaceae bacterium]|nr:DoxX family protein [Beijerinckiaceae bacterium]
MAAADTEPKLVFAFLEPFYERVIPLSWLLIRCTVGLILAVHGWGQVTRIAAYFAHGVVPAGGIIRIFVLMMSEFVGGLCIALGLFTRFFAPAAAIEMAVITFGVYWHNGFSWTVRGYEYTLMWGLLLFAIALRGGGPYSLDRLIGRQL